MGERAAQRAAHVICFFCEDELPEEHEHDHVGGAPVCRCEECKDLPQVVVDALLVRKIQLALLKDFETDVRH